MHCARPLHPPLAAEAPGLTFMTIGCRAAWDWPSSRSADTTDALENTILVAAGGLCTASKNRLRIRWR